jgi:hypothetical protein
MEELPGSHEASYTLFQWTSALRKAGLKASFLWPPYYDHLLEAGAGGTKFGPLGRIMTSFWRSDAVRRVVKGPLLPWLQMTVGINALFVARKRGV